MHPTDQLAAAGAAEARSSPRELTFSDLLDIVRSAWLAISICVLVSGAIAAVAAWTITPVYRATMLLAPAGGEQGGRSALSRLANQFAPLAGLMSGDGGSGLESREVWVATLKSRHLAEQFMKQRNLLPLLFPDRWDPATRQWKMDDGKSMMPTVDDAYTVFKDDVLSVAEDRRTGLVTLTVEWTDREVVASWANDLVKDANELIRARAIADAQQSLEYLQQELTKTDVAELRKLLYGLIESKISQAMLANVREEYAFAIIDPPVVPDAGNFVRPRRVVIVAVGILLGLVAGLAYGCIKWIRAADGR